MDIEEEDNQQTIPKPVGKPKFVPQKKTVPKPRGNPALLRRIQKTPHQQHVEHKAHVAHQQHLKNTGGRSTNFGKK